MPNPQGFANGPLVICTAQGLIRVLTPQQHKSPLPLSDHGQACPFAALAPLTPPQEVALATPTAEIAAAHMSERNERLSFAINARVHNPRAPPVTL